MARRAPWRLPGTLVLVVAGGLVQLVLQESNELAQLSVLCLENDEILRLRRAEPGRLLPLGAPPAGGCRCSCSQGDDDLLLPINLRLLLGQARRHLARAPLLGHRRLSTTSSPAAAAATAFPLLELGAQCLHQQVVRVRLLDHHAQRLLHLTSASRLRIRGHRVGALAHVDELGTQLLLAEKCSLMLAPSVGLDRVDAAALALIGAVPMDIGVGGTSLSPPPSPLAAALPSRLVSALTCP